MRDVRRTGGGRGLRGGQGKIEKGVFAGRPQSCPYQRRPVDDCRPGQGGMVQDGGTRGGTFHGEMDHCRETKVRAGLWHAIMCPNVTGMTKERIAQSKHARAGSLAMVDWLQAARSCILRTVMSCLSFSGVTFFWFCFVFIFFFVAFIQGRGPSFNRSSICMRAPVATRIYLTTVVCPAYVTSQ